MNPTKAVIYARYSSDNQREESIEGQIRECTEYAVRNDITILSSYIDRALSARTADRPEFQRMIADSEKGLFDVVPVSYTHLEAALFLRDSSFFQPYGTSSVIRSVGSLVSLMHQNDRHFNGFPSF